MAKKTSELWFVEFDGKFSPRLMIKAKKRLSDREIREQCERIEAKMLYEEIRRAQKKAYSTEVLEVAHI